MTFFRNIKIYILTIIKWKIKNIVLFHHEPTYSDKKILSFKKDADWYKEYPDAGDLSIFVAQEGMEINV